MVIVSPTSFATNFAKVEWVFQPTHDHLYPSPGMAERGTKLYGARLIDLWWTGRCAHQLSIWNLSHPIATLKLGSNESECTQQIECTQLQWLSVCLSSIHLLTSFLRIWTKGTFVCKMHHHAGGLKSCLSHWSQLPCAALQSTLAS